MWALVVENNLHVEPTSDMQLPIVAKQLLLSVFAGGCYPGPRPST